jgi:hypothetical protein
VDRYACASRRKTSPTKYVEEFTQNDADVAFNSIGFAKSTLMAGFTTVRDLGGSGVNVALRKRHQSRESSRT